MGTQLLCEVLGRDRRFSPLTAHSLDEITSGNIDVALIADTAQIGSFQGSGLIQELRRRRSDLPVVVLVGQSSPTAVVDAVRAGARGVLCRTEPIKTLGKCISCVHSGQLWANQKELEYLLQALTDPIPIRLVDAKGASLLSAREQDVVRWVAEGLTNREIADRLGLSEHTIKNYLFRIFEKLGISNRMELILYVVSQLAPRRARSDRSEQLSSGGDGQHADPIETSHSLPAYVLAERYRRGEGVSVDDVCAYMWFEIAKSVSAEIAEKAGSAMAELARSMNPERLADAKRRAEQWLARLQVSRNGSDPRNSPKTPPPQKVA
jgi:DNA-binding NarL/FixJ family response regulator